MCQKIRCGKCNKFTWTGCGMHAESIMKNIRVDQRCTCEPMKQKPQSQNYQQLSSQPYYFTGSSRFSYK